jgi:inorganic pyrophosphatase
MKWALFLMVADARRKATEYLGELIRVQIDRPLGSRHPQHGFWYPINYGFLPGVMSPDGEELDAYILDVSDPVVEFEGRCIAVIHRWDDDDDKLVVAPEGKTYTDEQIRALTEFQEQYFHSEIILRST